MEKRNKTIPSRSDQRQPPMSPEDRRTNERRKAEGDGYTYIPMVGWYCRREESRRDDDTIK